MIPDQQYFRPGLRRQGGDAVEGERARQGRLVDDDELSLAERLAGAVVGVEPLGRVLGLDAEVIGQDLRGDGGRRKPDHAAAPVLALPCPSQCRHRCRLPRTGRADQYIDHPA